MQIEPDEADQELEHHGFILRPWRAEMRDQLVAAVTESVASVGAWLPWCRADYGAVEASAWITQCQRGWLTGEQFAFALIDRASQSVLGGVGLNQRNRQHHCANLAYWVRPSRQRQGFAGVAARRVARFGFEQLQLQRIETVIMPDNVASRQTAAHVGAHFEGIARHRVLDDGVPRDAAVYGLLPGDLVSSDEERQTCGSS